MSNNQFLYGGPPHAPPMQNYGQHPHDPRQNAAFWGQLPPQQALPQLPPFHNPNLPLPPPPPLSQDFQMNGFLPFNQPPPPVIQNQLAHPVAAAPTNYTNNVRVTENVGAGREDGELSEGDRLARTTTPLPPPTAPNSLETDAALLDRFRHYQPGAPQEIEGAQRLLRVCHLHGISWQYLVQEVGLEPGILRALYNDIGIPVSQDLAATARNGVLPKPTAQPTALTHAVPAKVPPAQKPDKLPANLPAKPVMTMAPLSKPEAPSITVLSADEKRKQYLAKLQAAKSSNAQTAIAKEPRLETAATPAIDASTSREPKVANPANSNEAPVDSSVKNPNKSTATSNSSGAESTAVKAIGKNKASTELALQKLTELTRQKLAALASVQKVPASAHSTQQKSAAHSSEATPTPTSRTSSLSAIYTSGPEQAQVKKAESHEGGHVNGIEPITATKASQAPNGYQPPQQATPPIAWRASSGGIPGLFMTGSATSAAVPQNPSSQPAPSTPFGQPRHDPAENCVIDLSEDETETVASGMDIDECGESSTKSKMGLNVHKPQPKEAVKNLPSLTDVPSPATSTNQAMSTPPAAQTPGSQASADVLQLKLQAIAAMHKRIAEAEKRKQINKGKQTDISTPVTPAAALTAPVDSTSSQSRQSDVALQNATRPAPAISAPPTPMHITSAPVQSVQSLQSQQNLSNKPPAVGSEEWRKRRRAELQSEDASLTAQLAMDNATMDQLRREMEVLKASTERRMLEKLNLAKELESLGIDTEGMPHEQMQAKKDEIVQQREMEASSLHEVATKDYAQPARQFAQTSNQAPSLSGAANSSEVLVDEEQVPSEDDTSDHAKNANLHADLPLNELLSDIPEDHTPDNEGDAAIADGVQASTSDGAEATDESIEQPIDLQSSSILPTESNDPYEGTSTVHTQEYDRDTVSTSSDSDVMDESEGESDPGGITSMSGTPAETSTAAHAISMTPEDAENFYSPEVVDGSAEDFQEAQIEVNEERNVAMEDSLHDEDVVMEDIPHQRIISPQPEMTFNQQPTKTPLEDGEVEDHADQLISQHTPMHYEQTISTVANLAPESAHITELVDGASDSMPVSQQVPEADTFNPESKGSTMSKATILPYVPYQSVSRMTKSYRNHPDYLQNVLGGYRSMTYSHRIDPNKEVCPFETAGGVCNDSSCTYQHFRDMELSAADMLVQLGTANPGKTDEQKQQWNDGLKSIIRDLRSKNIDDPEIIASHFSVYRRQFLKDDSRIINNLDID